MDFPGLTVYTSYDDDPGSPYAPHWRHLIARVLLSDESLSLRNRALNDDEYLRKYLEVLKAGQRGITLPKSYRGYTYALARCEERGLECARPRLEAMLLTNVPYEVIAKDMGDNRLDPEYVKLFEKICFNTRDNKGALIRSCYLKTRFSVPIGSITETAVPAALRWRFIGQALGYTGLMYEWEWQRDCHGELQSADYIDSERYRQASTIVFNRILQGGAENIDLIGFMSHTVDRERINNEKASGKSSATREGAVVQSVLEAFAPAMIVASITADERKDQTKQLMSKLAANAAISETKIKDAGPMVGNEVISDELLKKYNSPER